MKLLELDNFVESVNKDELISKEQVNQFFEHISYDYTEPLPEFMIQIKDGNKNNDKVKYIDDSYNESNQDLMIIDGLFELSKAMYINDNGLEENHEFDFKDYFCCLEVALFCLENYKIKLKKKFMEHILKVIKGKFNLDI